MPRAQALRYVVEVPERSWTLEFLRGWGSVCRPTYKNARIRSGTRIRRLAFSSKAVDLSYKGGNLRILVESVHVGLRVEECCKLYWRNSTEPGPALSHPMQHRLHNSVKAPTN